MKLTALVITGYLLLSSVNLQAQAIEFEKYHIEPVGVSFSMTAIMGKAAMKVVKDSTVAASDEPTFVRIKGIDFKNGTIEVKVLSRLLKNAPEFARGFIGIAFHINESNSKFESIYIRPTNGRADDQVRRNHAIQYFAFPDYKFDRLRKEAPERYESYADMDLNMWITLRIEVKDAQARLFINDSKQPSLLVNDLKLGGSVSGAIGLWVETGTEGYFTDLKITKQ